MHWFWSRPTPPDIRHDETQRELDRTERDHEFVVDRGSLVTALVNDLRKAREVNHFAERLHAAYGWKR